MRFGANLSLIQGWLNQVWKDAILSNFLELIFESGFTYPLDGHLFLWDFDLLWPSVKVRQTKVENMHFCQPSRNWVLKVDLGTRLRDKHGHLFLWDLELIFPLLTVCQTKVEKMHFSRLSWNWLLKVDLGTHLRDKHGHLFYEIWSYFGTRSRLVKPRLKICMFVDFLGIDFSKWI